MIGKRLGNRFDIIEQLGGGGMAVVYKGKDSYLNRLVTIKVLRPEFASDEEFVKSFRQEAQAVARLSHPNIVHIHDVGQEGPIQYLVMEYVDGDNLKNLIRSKGILSPAQAIQIAVQVCDALEHAHENNIVHRDIKPHNILITTNGKVKLTDFGIAKETTAATLTQTDTIVGSVHYLSPEQAQGGEAGRKSDIYSLGVVMYEMFTGTVPFTGDNPVSVALKHVKEEPVPLKNINPDLPLKLQEVVLRAMSKSSEKRQSSAGELARQLQAVELAPNGEEEDLECTLVIPPEDFNTKVMPAVKPKDNKAVADDVDQLKPVKKKRRLRALAWLTVAIVLIGLAVVGVLALQNYVNVEEVIVPDVTGKDYEVAKVILEQNGLKAAKKEQHHSKVSPGKVISQSRGPEGPPVPKNQNRVITLTVSLGPEMKTVPYLIGKTKQEASLDLANQGLVLGEADPVFSDKEKGTIVEQKPEFKEKIPKGSEVKVFISKGPEPVMHEMPDLTGKKLEEVKSLLGQLNLELSDESTRQVSNKYLKDQVIDQIPEKGEQIQEGDIVKLIISDGPGPIPQDAKVEFDVPNNGQEHLVKIQVVDIRGISEPYVNTHTAGDTVEKTVRYFGQAIIRVYIDGAMVYEESMG